MNIKQSLIKQKLIGEKLNRATLWTAFGLYLALVIWVIGFKCNIAIILQSAPDMRSLPFKYRVRFIPFNFLSSNGPMLSLEYFLNVLIYVPMGIYLMFVAKEKVGICVLISFASSLAFEVEQYFTGFGGCDITDIICNVLGSAIGIFIYKKLRKKVTDKSVNKANFLVIALSTPVVIFAIVNTIINRHLYVIG